MLSLKGKVALVTGCGSDGEGWGNGKAISVLFARQGASLYGLDINSGAAIETADLIRSEGGIVATAACDLTNAGQVEAAVTACLAQFGRLDILVNNVGRSEPGGPADFSEEAWRAQFAVNLDSAFLACRAVLPIMERQGGGAIVNIASVAGIRYAGKPQVAYAAAKAAMIQMSKATAVLYAPRNVRLNCVVPGLMHTPLVRRLADKYFAGDYEGFVAHRGAQVPMGRMGDAWDVAHAALFLASDEARYITATEIIVDGGFTASTR